MIGFSLNILKNTKTNVKIITSPFKIQTDDKNQLIIFEDEKQQYINLNDIHLSNVGVLVYKNKIGEQALKLIASELLNGANLEAIVRDTKGQFCLVIAKNNIIYIITDKLGSFPIFKFEDDKKICVSNILRYAAESNDLSLNYQSLAEYLSLDYFFSETLFNEISLLDEGSIYEFKTNQVSKKIYDNYLNSICFNKYKNIDDVTELSIEILSKNLSVLKNYKKIFCDLTGGFDTRTILALIHELELDITCGICGEQNRNEIKIAERVANQLNCNFDSNIKLEDETIFRSNLNIHYQVSAGVPIFYHSTELVNYYQEIRKNYDIHIGGFAGSQLIDNWLPRLTLLSKKINNKALMDKSFRFINVFKKKFISKRHYYDNIELKINNIFQKLNTNRYDYVSNYLTLSTFSKYYHGYLFGTHNTFLPIYIPFLETNFVKLMMETSSKIKSNRYIQRSILNKINPEISKILTTHGYSAGIEKENFIKFIKIAIKNIQRRVIYSNKVLRKLNSSKESFLLGLKTKPKFAELQREFWLQNVENAWSDNSGPIFHILDYNKLSQHLPRDDESSKLKAKILYIDKLLTEFDPKL